MDTSNLVGAEPLVMPQRRSYNPFEMLTHGPQRESPHRAQRTTVFYVRGGDRFFVLPGNARRVSNGTLVCSCSIQAALRRGLTWDPEDEREVRQGVRERAEASAAMYDVDGNGTRRLVVPRSTRRVKRRTAAALRTMSR